MGQTINLTVANSIYLLVTGFSTYIIFKFMSVFFEREDINKLREFGSYCLYFIIISAVYLIFRAPMLTMVSNLLLFFALSYNYKATLKSRILAVIFMYAILLLAEVMTLLALPLFGVDHCTSYNTKEYIIAQISIQIIIYIIALLLSNFKSVKNKIDIPLMHWVAAVAVPLCTLLPVSEMLLISNDANSSLMISMTVIIFAINIFVFYLYDVLTHNYQKMLEVKLLHQQNEAYIIQLEIMTQSQENLRVLRHDIKNHMQMLKNLMIDGTQEDVEKYLNNIITSVDRSDAVKSGNNIVDSIINYKTDEAHKSDIEIIAEGRLPVNLEIEPFDLNSVISNLLDNAINAVSQMIDLDQRVIHLNAAYDKNVLYIMVANPYAGEIAMQDGQPLTSKADQENHGLGLLSIKKVVEKYRGDMKISFDNGIFVNEVMMFNKKF